MPPICSNIFRPMLRPLCRYAHLNGTPRIYITVPNWKPGPGWRPQSPQGPYLDGWAMGYWHYTRPHNLPLLFAKAAIYLASAFWLPFFVVEYQLKKSKAAS
uniref:Cytochrome c oxidase polypeptide VIIc n=1 Tax=Meloidogyne incognita TaxID=6306 RepID=A0A914LEY6_MELIC